MAIVVSDLFFFHQPWVCLFLTHGVISVIIAGFMVSNNGGWFLGQFSFINGDLCKLPGAIETAIAIMI